VSRERALTGDTAKEQERMARAERATRLRILVAIPSLKVVKEWEG
jgi:hypothetical protein